jgi:uncharacterized protein YxeA
MINYDLFERNKNLIINIAIVILAMIIAFQFHKSANDKIDSLVQEEKLEQEKNKVAENIAILEKKAEAYKKVFVKKDLASVMDTLSGIAKDTAVKIISVKPSVEETQDNYTAFPFLITLDAPSYHALGDFISKIENHKDIFLVNDIVINSVALNPDAPDANVDLGVSLKIYTISY